MAKAGKNVVVRGLSGSIRNLVFRQMPDGSTYISSKQDFSRRTFSAGQKDHQDRFREAAAYAREAARAQPIYAQLAAGQQKSAYNYALSDWFQPPVVHQIERVEGGCIRVLASDNVLVARVRVTILDGAGNVLEQGPAAQVDAATGTSTWWEYAPKTDGRVLAEAWDLAGNVARAEL